MRRFRLVLASQTDFLLGDTAGPGDVIETLIIVPSTPSPGPVTLKDGSDTVFTFDGGGGGTGGAIIPVPLKLSAENKFTVTTGANVRALAVGQFT